MGEGRCSECGSWERECSSEVPVSGCRCVRCGTTEIARLRADLEGMVEVEAIQTEEIARLRTENEELRKVRDAAREYREAEKAHRLAFCFPDTNYRKHTMDAAAETLDRLLGGGK